MVLPLGGDRTRGTAARKAFRSVMLVALVGKGE